MEKLTSRADRVFVGGVNSPVRSFRRVGGHPVVVKSAEGAFITDAENKSYLDCVMSYGPHLFGHLYGPVHEALQRAIREGLCFGMTSEREILWGEKITSLLKPAFNEKKIKVRALSSGTEACMTAIRLARGFTQREVVLKCSGHYHGHVDSLLFDAGSGVATLSEEAAPDSAGLPQSLGKILKVIPFNDIAALEEVFANSGQQIAAFILEPIMGNMGVVVPHPLFLQKARELTTKHQALLIFDEVMTGFRVAALSAMGLWGVEPDLVTLGKIVGGGMPLAAIAGPENIMNHLAPLGKVYQAGTLSGNPVGTAAGLAMLTQIESENPYARLDNLGKTLQTAIEAVGRKKGLALSVARCGSMLSIFFRAELPQNAAQARDVDFDLFNKFFWNALKVGLMLPPSPFEAYFLSTAHEPHCAQLVDKFTQAIGDL